jgi:hypothetical protein
MRIETSHIPPLGEELNVHPDSKKLATEIFNPVCKIVLLLYCRTCASLQGNLLYGGSCDFHL